GVLRLHDADRFLAAEEHGVEIDIHHRLPGLQRQVLHRHRRRAHAGVVEQDIEPAPFGHHLAEDLLHDFGPGDVAGENQRALGRARVGRGLVEQLPAASDQRDAIAVLEKRERRRLADAGAGARDERNLVVHDFRSCLSMKSISTSLNRPGRSRFTRWPAPLIITSSAPGMRRATSRARAGGYTVSSSPDTTSVGTRMFSIGAPRSCATDASSVLRNESSRIRETLSHRMSNASGRARLPSSLRTVSGERVLRSVTKRFTSSTGMASKPGEVLTSVRLCRRSGQRSATLRAMRPPIDRPTRCAFFAPKCSRTRITSPLKYSNCSWPGWSSDSP